MRIIIRMMMMAKGNNKEESSSSIYIIIKDMQIYSSCKLQNSRRRNGLGSFCNFYQLTTRERIEDREGKKKRRIYERTAQFEKMQISFPTADQNFWDNSFDNGLDERHVYSIYFLSSSFQMIISTHTTTSIVPAQSRYNFM